MRETGLYNLVKHYRKYWLTILILSLVGFIMGLIYNGFIQNPKYKSNATLIIIKTDESANSKNSTLINNYIRLFKSRKVLEPTIKDLKLNMSYDELTSSIEATNDTDTEVVKLSVISGSSKTSKEVLNHAIDIFKDEAKRLYKKDNIQIVDSASLESSPFNVNAPMQLLIATGIGFLIPVIIIFFIYDIDFYNKKRQDESTEAIVSNRLAIKTRVVIDENTPSLVQLDEPIPIQAEDQCPLPAVEAKPVAAVQITNTPDPIIKKVTTQPSLQTPHRVINNDRNLTIPSRRG